MLMVIGEGKFDDIFFYQMFTEIQLERQQNFRIKHQLQELPRLLSCISDSIQKNMYYKCYLWGDHGKNHLLNFSLKIIKQVLGYIEGESFFYIVRDTDSGNEDQIFKNWGEEIKNFTSSNKNFSRSISYKKIEKNHFVIERNHHNLHIILKLIPFSLEYQIGKLYCDSGILKLNEGQNIHDFLDDIAKKRSIKVPELILDSYNKLKENKWCKDIKTEIVSKIAICDN